MSKPPTFVPVVAASLMTSPATANLPKLAVSYGAPHIASVGRFEGGTMTPQETALLDAKIEAKTFELRGDIRLNTQGLDNLQKRFELFTAQMSSVPTDIATLKTSLSELPTKDYLREVLRQQLVSTGVVVAIIGGIIGAAAHFWH